ncbi:hypothetical protein DUNSADRAFT_16727 [Dunaliella salina]|uniref:Anticodon-binding domain-containing protein n=2 Tax=Dunaliella salina TaxID=3046 RepID=A0ABQ7G315_DUNSA|nr:hypothetical protein DUNSADRAFT_16727 [Dunaliella salina]|eukprot:KAF5828998.1 hypothetical protein DUNSADRAFT_16727 [Dunaliella salina]
MGRESGRKRKFQQEQRLAAESAAANKPQGETALQQQQQDGSMQKKAKKDKSQLPPAEIERRKIQRELRELALKVKAAGGQYKPQKYKRKVYKEHGAELVGSNKAKKDKDKKRQRDTPSWRPYDKVDVALLLRENSIDTHIDDANSYTPGQKMKYWETAGVLVRVEVGPKEAQNGTAVVALANEPGTVAAKETVNVDLQLMKEIRAKLEQAGARMGATGRAGKEERKRQKAQQQQLVQAQEQGEGATGPEDDSKEKGLGPQASSQGEEHGSGAGSEEGNEVLSEEESGARENSEGENGSEESESEDEAGVCGTKGQIADGSSEGEGEVSEVEQLQQGSVAAKQAGATGAKKKEKHKGSVEAKGETQHKSGGELGDASAKHNRKKGKQPSKAPPQQQHQLQQPHQQQKQQQQQQQQLAPRQAPQIQGGGDELEDDFEIEPQFMPEPEEEEQTVSKKDRLKQARKNDKAWRKQGRFGKEGAKAWDSSNASNKTAGGAKKEKRPTKVVTF